MCRAKHTRVPDLSPFFLTKPHMLILVLLYILQTGRKEKAGWILILQNISLKFHSQSVGYEVLRVFAFQQLFLKQRISATLQASSKIV